MLVGLVAVVLSVLSSAPASAAETMARPPLNGTPGWHVVRNLNMWDGQCLANHAPSVFMATGCTGQYNDQYWQMYSNGRIQNYHTLGCLAAHSNGHVFTAQCNDNWADQVWGPYQGNRYLLENKYHAGRCLAAHSNGYVFLFSCNAAYEDQGWVVDA